MPAILVRQFLRAEIEKILKGLSSEINTADFRIEIPPEKRLGEFSTNAAMVCARQLKSAPKSLAEKIVSVLNEKDFIEKTEIAGPGFINFWLKDAFYINRLSEFLSSEEIEKPNIGKGKKIQIEFVSANPTGPLTVGHGRQAIIGDVLSCVFNALGYNAQREYYFNDSGKQMKLLSRSLWVRYNELLGSPYEIPEGGYHGSYITDLAEKVSESISDKFKDIWNSEAEEFFLEKARSAMFDNIKNTLNKLKIHFDTFFSEGSLFTDGTVEEVKKILLEKGKIFEKDGALWLKVSDYFDEEDKVLIRSDGMPTYFFTDIANHYKKYQRGFEEVFDIWGADHHGHIPRMKAAMEALEIPEGFLNIILHQMVTLKKNGEIVKMSTRSGEFSTLDELINTVGNDAVRYFYAMVDKDTQMVFDIDLAERKSVENPVFYVQYAHARICSLFKISESKGLKFTPLEDLQLLCNEDDKFLIRDLLLYPEVLLDVIENSATHRLTNYIYSIASDFHNYYTSNVFVSESSENLTNARLNLAFAVRKLIADGLGMLGVSAPESMR